MPSAKSLGLAYTGGSVQNGPQEMSDMIVTAQSGGDLLGALRSFFSSMLLALAGAEDEGLWNHTSNTECLRPNIRIPALAQAQAIAANPTEAQVDALKTTLLGVIGDMCKVNFKVDPPVAANYQDGTVLGSRLPWMMMRNLTPSVVRGNTITIAVSFTYSALQTSTYTTVDFFLVPVDISMGQIVIGPDDSDPEAPSDAVAMDTDVSVDGGTATPTVPVGCPAGDYFVMAIAEGEGVLGGKYYSVLCDNVLTVTES